MSKIYLVLFIYDGEKVLSYAQFGEEQEMLNFMTVRSQGGSKIVKVICGRELKLEPVHWVTEYRVREKK